MKIAFAILTLFAFLILLVSCSEDEGNPGQSEVISITLSGINDGDVVWNTISIELSIVGEENLAQLQLEVNGVITQTFDRLQSSISMDTRDFADGELIIIDFFKSEIPVGPPMDHKLAMDVVVTELKEAGYTSFDVNVELLPYHYIIRAK